MPTSFSDGWTEDAIEDFLGMEGKDPTQMRSIFKQIDVIKAQETSKETKTPDAHVLHFSEWFGDEPHGLAGKLPPPRTPTPNPARELVTSPLSPAKDIGQLSMEIPQGQGLPDDSTRSQDEMSAMEERPRQEVREYGGLAHSWYAGQWFDEERHGRGKLERADGSTFEGFFVHGRAHGPGIFTLQDGSIYWGQWRDGHSHGFGRCLNKEDASTYTGEWRHNEKCGQGFEAWQDGTEYDGAFLDGFKHGHGHYTSIRVNGNLEYVGQFKDDRMDGHGSYTFPDGRKYAGEWDHGHIHGSGRMDWPNGCHYDGQYERDRKHGFGHFVWPDGKAYRGEWLNGNQHGEGVRISKDGKQTKSSWRHGKLVEHLGREPPADMTPPSSPTSELTASTDSVQFGVSLHSAQMPKRSRSFIPVLSTREQDHLDHAARSHANSLIREKSARLDAEHRSRTLSLEDVNVPTGRRQPPHIDTGS